MNTKEKVDRIIQIKELDKKQEIVNHLYKNEGLTDEVLDLQIEINKKRHETNITDPNELVYKNFVQ